MKSKECIALILAGGQGKRLDKLTSFRPKPAIAFGGNFRLIDFPLSNCVNSGISTIGVLTQYKPLELSCYIGDGGSWGLNRLNGGISILPPYVGKFRGDWYNGTANAVFQNLEYIDKHSPENVLIMPGNQIYKMNYAKMLAFHKAHSADCTIAATIVQPNDAQTSEIILADETGKIRAFGKKTNVTKSAKVSMGIYLFDSGILKKYLLSDSPERKSSCDFVKDIIPHMLRDGCKLYSYPFFGYWRDITTPQSLWKANMDLINDSLLLRNPEWKIYSNLQTLPPTTIHRESKIKNSVIGGGCEISGSVENSVIFGNVKIDKNTYVKNSVILQNSVISDGCEIVNCLINENTRIPSNCQPGENHIITSIANNLKNRTETIEKSVVS